MSDLPEKLDHLVLKNNLLRGQGVQTSDRGMRQRDLQRKLAQEQETSIREQPAQNQAAHEDVTPEQE